MTQLGGVASPVILIKVINGCRKGLVITPSSTVSPRCTLIHACARQERDPSVHQHVRMHVCRDTTLHECNV